MSGKIYSSEPTWSVFFAHYSLSQSEKKNKIGKEKQAWNCFWEVSSERPATDQFNAFKGLRRSLLSSPFLGLLFARIIFLAIEMVLYQVISFPSSQTFLKMELCQVPIGSQFQSFMSKTLKQS